MSNKAEKRGLVPKLRFPEFRGAGEWEERKVGALFANRIEDGEEGLPIYSVTMNDGMVKRSSLERRVEDIAESGGNKKVRKGDIAYNMMRMWQGAFGVSKEDCMVSPAYVVLSPESDARPDFFGYLFKLPKYLQLLTSHSQGLTLDRLRLYYKDFARISVSIPSPSEQQKIADCLASLDELMTLEAQKLDTLKTHKKGLMQQIFPAEGETLPKLRFPEFQDAGEWEEKAVGDIGEVVTGSTPSTVRPEFYGGGIPFVSPADISDLRFVNETKTTLTALGFDETRPIKANSVLFVCIGSTIGKVAQNVRDCATNQQINSVIPNAEHSSGFVYYTLSLNAERIANLAGKQAVPIINKTQFSAVRLPVPELREQERIAASLASLDDLITTQTQKIAAFKTHKKGLMQQIFPNLAEE